MKAADLEKLTQKSGEMAAQIDEILMMMKRNQLSPHEYIQTLNHILGNLVKAIQSAAQSSDRQRQQILAIKKDIVCQEVSENCRGRRHPLTFV